MIYQTMGDRIKLAIELRNMKQIDLAKKIGMTDVTICHYISGEREPRADAIVAICRALSISADWLLGMTGNNSIDCEDWSRVRVKEYRQGQINILKIIEANVQNEIKRIREELQGLKESEGQA